VVLALALLVAAPAMAQIKVEDAWSRATPPGAKMAAGYLVIHNSGPTPDRLVGASSPAAERVTTHITVREGDISKMREVKGYEIPAGGSFEAKPGGAHLMFENIKAPFKEGESIPATLRFAKAGDIKVEFRVAPLTGGMPMHHGH
jgi:copper(I)-binding protein